jgi:hypothetical protein
MKKVYFLLAGLLTAVISLAQNVGIGLLVPNRGQLHVASPASNITIAAFGSAGSTGVSIDDNNPLIGFNNYKEAGVRKFMGSSIGYSSILYFETTVGKLRYNMAGNRGTEGQNLSAYKSILAIDSNGNMGLGTVTPSEAKLMVLEEAGNTQFIAAAGNNLPGVSTFVPVSSPSIGYNVRFQGGYKFMGAGYGGFWQFSPTLGRLYYYYSSTKGVADGAVSSAFGLVIDSSGRLGIGLATPTAPLHVTGNVVFGSSAISPATGYRLSVDGKIICEELKVQLSGSWPDYVFENNYPLLPLDQLQQLVMEQKHLPGVPSAADVKAGNGVEMGDMQKRLLEKVEELYRYVFELNAENKALKEELKEVKKKIQ